jgi:mannan endo-1,6-alpha-mannosidase
MGLLNASDAFFSNGTMYEGCENGPKGCNVDQRSFKAYFSRWLAATAELAPFTHPIIMPKLATSAAAAIKTCTAGNSGTQCGLKWGTGENDGSIGVGEQMAVLEVVQSNLVDGAPGWVSAVKGTGTSEGNANAGSGSKQSAEELIEGPITTADKVGAGILTTLVLMGVVSGSAVMIMA